MEYLLVNDIFTYSYNLFSHKYTYYTDTNKITEQKA